MTSPILVTGGTGTLGRHVTALLREGGHKVRVLCRHDHAPDDGDTATRNLVHAVAAVGRPHLVYISVTAVDRMPIGWFRSKLRAEQAVAESGLPWTTLRAAQFHEFVLTMAQSMAKLPVIPVPGGLRLQPVDSREVHDVRRDGDDREIRSFSKPTWIVLLVIGSVLRGLMWIYLGRPQRRLGRR